MSLIRQEEASLECEGGEEMKPAKSVSFLKPGEEKGWKDSCINNFVLVTVDSKARLII